MKDELPKVIVTGIVLGVVAGAVVWFLERFQTNRLVEELKTALDDEGALRQWLDSRPGKPQ